MKTKNTADAQYVEDTQTKMTGKNDFHLQHTTKTLYYYHIRGVKG